MQTKRLRWGVLGTARIADTQVRAIKMSSNSELAAVASRDIDSARVWADQRGVPYAFGGYDDMLASDVIDAVYVPLPNALHKQWSIRAMQHGKHVLCEKPLAGNAADVQEMIAVSEQNGVKLMEGFMYRFHPQVERLMQLLSEGAIGEVKVIRATFGFLLDRPEDIRWSTDLLGGALNDVGCYCVSFARMVARAEPIAVTASADWARSGVDQTLVGTLEFPDNVLGTLDCSFQTGVVHQQFVSISGTEGLITVPQPFRKPDTPVTIIINKSDGGDYPGTIEAVEIPAAFQSLLMVEHFADAVLNNKPLKYPPQDSLGNLRVMDALREAAKTGKKVIVGV
jgi:xylose dehydrogenase (NAD/NADP)